MAAPQTTTDIAELARECEVLTHERDELQFQLDREREELTAQRNDVQFELAWNEHTIAGLQEQLRAEQQDHAHTDARAIRLWELLKQQTRQLRALREKRESA